MVATGGGVERFPIRLRPPAGLEDCKGEVGDGGLKMVSDPAAGTSELS